MPVPVMIREHLERTGEYNGLSGFALDDACQGAQHHSPRPITLHRVILPEGGTTLLCGTCRDNLTTLRHLTAVTSGPLPWGVRREFGNAIRALAGC